MKIRVIKEIWKVCSNENCRAHTHKSKYDEDVTYCPYCGNALYHVCKHTGCYEPIEDPKATLCEKHMSEKQGKNKNKVKELADNTDAAGKTITGALAIAGIAVPVIQKGFKSLTKHHK